MNPSRTINILIVEDDFIVSDSIRESVETLNCTVVGIALNGHEAVEMTKALKPDVVLMDIQMPTMDGFEATRIITRDCLAPVVILSAYDNPELEKKAASVGAAAYLVKMPYATDIERTIAIAMARFEDMAELRRLNLELSTTQQLAKLGSWELDLETLIITLSPEHQMFLNPKPRESSMNLFEYAEKYLVPQDLPVIRERLAYAVQNNESESYSDAFEYRLKTEEGEIRFLAVQCFFKSKGIIHGVTQDITERKQAEQKRAHAKTFLDNIINAMPNPVFIKNEQHQWIMMNDAFCSLVGHPRAELLGKSDYDYFSKQEADIFWKNDNRVFASGETYSGEEQYTDSQGIAHSTLTHKSMITDENGKRVLIGVTTDVTELQEARIEAESANRAKSKFLANMSHEIRTPLNAVLGFTDLLVMEENDTRKRERLSMVKKSGENLLILINDILDLSKIEADKLEIVPERFEIIEMLEYLRKTFTQQAAAKNLAFNLSFETAFPQNVTGDKQRINQILTNLLSNAVKFTPDGHISLICSYEKGQAGFKVTDTGIGIPKEKQGHIFAPFTQADVSTSRDFGGTGLGLVISRRLAEMMNGTLTLKSTPDSGSAFFVRLPLPVISENCEAQRGIAELKDKIDGKAMVERWLQPGDYGYDRPEYVRLALLDLPSQTARLKDAVRRNRQRDIEFIAHSIKGATGNLGMAEIYKAASAINDESIKKEYDINFIKHLLKNLEAILEVVPEEYFKDDIAELLNRLGRKSVRSDFKILMAEDNKMNQLLVIDLLQRIGLGVTIAQNGRQALDMLTRKKYGLLLLDIQMPVMDGLETIARIRQDDNLKNLHVIALTAHAIKGDADKYIKAGCDDYLAKPIKFAKLYQKVGAVIRSKNSK